MKCKCGGELWEDNQKVTKFLACIKCKQFYEVVEYNPPKKDFGGFTITFDVDKIKKKGD